MKLFVCMAAMLLAGGYYSDGNAAVGRPPEDKKKEDSKDDTAKEQKARNGARVIEQACKKYYLENGNWPAKLADIADMLENGKKDLLDPWEKEYKFAVVKSKDSDGSETERLYVWTERTVDGKTKVYGTKPPEEKKP